MLSYLFKRLGLMLPTLLGVLTINFFLIQMAPGGPVEQYIAQLEGNGDAFLERVTTGGGTEAAATMNELSGDSSDAVAAVGAKGISPEVLKAIEEMYGFDKPIGERFVSMLVSYLTFDFGESLFKAASVVELIVQALPVSVSLGLWSTLIIYMVSIPLGVARAMRRNSRFDAVTGFTVIVLSAIPSFLFAVVLIVFFAGGSYLQWFPLRGLHSLDTTGFTFIEYVLDYLWHIALPILSLTIGGFAGLSLLTRNSFLDELEKQYVDLALAKGVAKRTVLYKHVFRNAMLIVISGLPGMFVRMFFMGSILIETIFSLNGIGLLGFEAAMQRDYPVMFSTLYIFTLIGLVTGIIGDILMHWVDPRIDFTSRRRA